MNNEPKRYKHLFRALSSGNSRLLFFGQGISLIGTWIQSVAQAWLVYKMTNSVLLLGLVGFLGQIMIFIFGPFAGVIADRMNRHRILVITQTAAMVQAFILSALVLTRTVQVWHIMVLSLLLGMINSFDVPVREPMFRKPPGFPLLSCSGIGCRRFVPVSDYIRGYRGAG